MNYEVKSMKHNLAFPFLCLILLSIALTGCRGKENVSLKTPTVTPMNNSSESSDPSESDTVNKETTEIEPVSDPKVIHIWTSYGNELPDAITKFKKLHPDFGYKIIVTDYTMLDVSYSEVLDSALSGGKEDAPDIYASIAPGAVKYIKGDMFPYAAPYEDLGLDVNTLLQEASIEDYMIDFGTNPDGNLVTLGYQSTAAAFLYRRTIAKDVWGTDDPAVIKDTIGPGWDKFFEAAETLKSKGYGICSGHEDIWYAVKNNSDQGWIVNDKLNIDPKREAFLDLSKRMIDNEYTNGTDQWTDGWIKDMNDAGNKKIFGFFAPSWLIKNMAIYKWCGEAVGNGTYGDWALCVPPAGFFWGGTYVLANKDTKYKEAVGEIIKWITLDTSVTGFQYMYASGEIISGLKEAVSSVTVMEKSDGSMDLLGGQNQFDIFIPAADFANGNQTTQYDDDIDYYWLNEVTKYIFGNKTRQQAIADFKQEVADHLGIMAE